ncbi:cryptochrome/photolyase family protein [Zooshikella sp. RANM57]|uniref:cryptochrome/photolyase family protein n=1 Tax=Zooshikella sp. RANM57 TaxID=3425863 RepID=UPI003D6E6772
MAKTRSLILILGDQLNPSISSLMNFDPQLDQIVMAEVWEETHYVLHHQKKIALIFSAMRHFAQQLKKQKWPVHYHQYHPDSPYHSLLDVLKDAVNQYSPQQLLVTQCGEWRLHHVMQTWSKSLAVPVHILEDDRFVCSITEFKKWAAGRKQLRMEYFYRYIRQKTGLLMENNNPIGEQWNFDKKNRKSYRNDPPVPPTYQCKPDKITQNVLNDVTHYFPNHFGQLKPFWFAVTAEQATAALTHFIEHKLAYFGDFQDAMSHQHDFLFHSIISIYLNIGLLDPITTCKMVEQAYRQGKAPLNAVEGFIRQIIGWREYVRGIYWLKMPAYAKENAFNNKRCLPSFYWTTQTKMQCMHQCLKSTYEHAYAHHIQRLMVTGNFALLAGITPSEICEWYLAVYADAFEWVELPNTLGMVMHADDGLLGSKPYAASGKYIDRMSDYCKGCHYNVKTQYETDSCPFNALYWFFLITHYDKLQHNPRMKLVLNALHRKSDAEITAIKQRAHYLIKQLDNL